MILSIWIQEFQNNVLDALFSNSWLKYLGSSLITFLTNPSNEELRNWKLPMKLTFYWH